MEPSGSGSRSRSTLINHTIPPFYACYLLRSRQEASNGRLLSRTYIGSTPDPYRRIRQHNGILKSGGAWKTKRGRPWEMEIIVHGFPSKLTALQFEWAWQNPEKSRHFALKRETASASQGGGAMKVAKQISMKGKILVLQSMICSPPWDLFNLEVTVFGEEAWDEWKKNLSLQPTKKTKKMKEVTWTVSLTDAEISRLKSIKVNKRFEGVDGARLQRRPGEFMGTCTTHHFKANAVDDDFALTHLKQWHQVSTSNTFKNDCHRCGYSIDIQDHLSFVICPTFICSALFHVKCLATFLVSRSESLIPDRGSCPSCSGVIIWMDLIRCSYRRQEVNVMGKKVGQRNKIQPAHAEDVTSQDLFGDDESNDEYAGEEDTSEGPDGYVTD